jgi:hypothetical protein
VYINKEIVPQIAHFALQQDITTRFVNETDSNLMNNLGISVLPEAHFNKGMWSHSGQIIKEKEVCRPSRSAIM